MKRFAGRTAVVVTDPQNDFLSPEGVTWGVVGQNVTDNNTVENIGQLFATAGAGMFDEFNQPNDILQEVLGVRYGTI